MNHSSSNSLKSKIFALFFAIAALSAYAGEGNTNFNGQFGVHKTQSAQTLGHGRFGIGFFLEGAGLKNTIEEQKFCAASYGCSGISGNYIGMNAYPFLSFGLSDYFDISIGIPAYGEFLELNESIPDKNLWALGYGDLFISTKWRAPFNESLPLDIALLLGFGASTSKEDDGRLHAYGAWIRDPMFLNINSKNPISAGEGKQSTYSNMNPFLKLGAAMTFDFGRIKAEIPLLIHLNGAYRMTLGEEGNDYSKIPSFSAAFEWTPVKFVSIFTEYYRDIPLKWPADRSSINLSTTSIGSSFHLGKAVDLQLGVQIFTGDKEYIKDITVNTGDEPRDKASYSARLIPNYMTFGGLTIKIFAIEPRDPDTDKDGLCDPWVTENGKQNEFARICKGIDLCPYEPGLPENKGCPAGKLDAPAIMFTAMPDVVQKGQSVTLSWQVTNATSVNIEGLGDVPNIGSRKLKPTENTVYKLTAVGQGGTQTVEAEIEVTSGPLPTVLFTVSPETVQVGHPVTLKWQVSDATEVTIEGLGKAPIEGLGSVSLKGTKQVKPTENTTFKLTAVGQGGTHTETADVEVTTAPVIEARVNLTGVTFGSGNAVLTANAKKILDGVAEQLLANPKVKIEIQGHTDNVGKPLTNKQLSEKRAKSVVAYLAMKGVRMDRMSAVGYGQELPIADNSTVDGRELNRRIEMVRIDD